MNIKNLKWNSSVVLFIVVCHFEAIHKSVLLSHDFPVFNRQDVRVWGKLERKKVSLREENFSSQPCSLWKWKMSLLKTMQVNYIIAYFEIHLVAFYQKCVKFSWVWENIYRECLGKSIEVIRKGQKKQVSNPLPWNSTDLFRNLRWFLHLPNASDHRIRN